MLNHEAANLWIRQIFALNKIKIVMSLFLECLDEAVPMVISCYTVY